MKLIYITAITIDKTNLNGVPKKILSQYEAFQNKYGISNIWCAYFKDSREYIIENSKLANDVIQYKNKNSTNLNIKSIYGELLNYIIGHDINVVYYRYHGLTDSTMNFFKKLKENKVKIIIEIPTYPFWKERWGYVIESICHLNVIKTAKECATNMYIIKNSSVIKRYVDRIVTYSNIQKIWGIDVINISNGYKFVKGNMSDNSLDTDINIVMAANFRKNHGADRVIEGFNNYYHQEDFNKYNVRFHIIGDGPELPNLVRLIEKYNLEEKIIVHKSLYGKKLEEIYATSDIGVSALGFHRLNVGYCSPLKSKEYFNYGLYVVGTTAEEDILQSSCSKYYYPCSTDDSAIDIKDLCNHFKKIRDKKLKNIIFETSKDIFSWDVTMKSVFEYISS